MTSLGRVGRILAGTIDVSNSSIDKDAQSSNALNECSAATSTSSVTSTPVDATETRIHKEKQPLQNNNKIVLQGMRFRRNVSTSIDSNCQFFQNQML